MFAVFAYSFSGWEILLIAGVLILLFGARKLPALAKSLGTSWKGFRKGVNSKEDDTPAETREPDPADPTAARKAELSGIAADPAQADLAERIRRDPTLTTEQREAMLRQLRRD